MIGRFNKATDKATAFRRFISFVVDANQAENIDECRNTDLNDTRATVCEDTR